jgi:hypothetical protein
MRIVKDLPRAKTFRVREYELKFIGVTSDACDGVKA